MELWDKFLDRALLTHPDPRSTVLALSQIPYGRPSQPTPAAVIDDWKGTCSTKHLLLRELFGACWPSTQVQLLHRVYRMTRDTARARWGVDVASAVPSKGLIDVHTYATARLPGEPIVLDVTFPLIEWDGHSPMEVASGPGRDCFAGPEPMAEKQRLVEAYCDPTKREPFIAALSAALGAGA